MRKRLSLPASSQGAKYLKEEKLARVMRKDFLELMSFELSFESWKDFSKCQGKILDRGNLTKTLIG